ncbi:hypothetical protein ACXR2U_21615 [Jatrophihabitans sp. YIM 134969]
MSVRWVATSVAGLLLVGALAGCTETIAGTPGPAPQVTASGDFPTGDPTDPSTDAPSDEPTDTPTDEPTDEPTDTPTDDPTGVTTTNPDSPETLCANLDVANKQGDGVPSDVVRSYVRTIILAWGIANSDSDPYSKADAVTTKTCPDVRSGVLKLMDLPNLKSVDS